MYDSLSQRTKRRLSLCLVAVLALLATASSPASAADPAATLTIDANPKSIDAGDATEFTVVLTNSSGAPALNQLLALELSGPVDKWNATISEATDVRTDNVRRVNNTLYWKGDLKDGGSATFVVRVVSASLIVDFEVANAMTGTSVESARIGETSGSELLVLTGEVGPIGEPPVAEGDETVTVQFPGPVDHEQIDFSKLIEYQDGDDLLLRNEAEISSRQQVTVVLSLTNRSDKPVYSLLIDSLAIEDSHGAALDADASACRLDVKRAWVNKGRGATVPLDALGDEYGKNAISAFMIRTEPDETSEARVRGTVIGSPDCVLAGMAGAYMTASGPSNETAPKLAIIRHLLGQQPKWTQAVKFFMLLSDFGDAPDSTNHFPGVSMDAYPGIEARFPTVFDSATGTPPGPKHGNGRPLHLGGLVSAELAVDAGARKNIDPPTDTADLDVRDDGIDPLSLSFQHCVATDIDVEVTLTQVAIDHFANTDSNAYLNIWLDGNHDGDWEDMEPCDGLNAREHIVIDQPVNPSTAGTIKLTIPTRPIPVPQGGENETMWLRVTLSDEKSVKVDAAKTYGDGQGPATGLRWGETEDYLYVPNTAVAAPGGFGPDMSITAESSLQTDLLAATISAAGTNKIAGLNFLKLQIRNRGDRLSPNATLEIEMDPHGGIPPIISH